MMERRKKTTSVLTYLRLLIIVFVAGMITVVGLRLTFEKVTDQLSDLASNEKARQTIGNHIATDINDMESLYFQLAPVSGLYELNLYVEQIRHLISHIRKDVDILEFGGVFESKTLLNTPQTDSMNIRLPYKPDPNQRYILAAIELRPQLPELEKRIDFLVKLLEDRTRLRREGNAEGYFIQIKLIQNDLRRAIPLFQRLKETANNILFESAKELENIENVINAKKKSYRIIEAFMYVGLLLLFGLLSVLITGKIRDIVKKEQESDEELRKSGAFLNTILESITHPFRVVDLKTNQIEISNPAAKAEPFDPNRTKCFGAPEDTDLMCVPDNYAHVLDEVKKTGKSVTFLETQNENGVKRFLEHRAYPVIDQDGNINKLIEYWIDVTDQKQAEHEKMMLAAAIEQSEASVLIADSDGKIFYVNPAFENKSGFDKHEVFGRDILEVVTKEENEKYRIEIWDSLRQGNSWRSKLISRKKTGKFYDESAIVSPIFDNDGWISNFVAIKRDISVEVELEKQVRHAQKMEAIGTLAGGIAHDFNNLLQIVLGYSDMLLDKLDPKSSETRKLKAIRKAASNGAELVKQLLAFSRKTPVSLEFIDLNTELKRISDLLFRTIPKMIEIKLNLEPELHIIELDSTQFEQVVLNLATNARDAMHDGGVLLLQTKNIFLDDHFCERYPELQPGDYVLVTVSDTGHGMSAEVASHIFEPFFSTKDIGQGTGLGLSTVFGIVQAHRGHIICDTKTGVGTTFSIYLPKSRTTSDITQSRSAEVFQKGSETILVVEDDYQMRELLMELLESMGYETLGAATGVEGLEIYQEHQQRISLVILDLIMPLMGGHKCLEGLLMIDPDVRVLVASGCSEDIPRTKALETGAKAFINKPYDIHKMLQAVRDVLDAA